MKEEYKTLEFINGYKLVLCFIVIIGHFYNYIGGRTIWGIRLLGAAGAKAVDAFLFISGFLMVYSVVQRKQEPYRSLRTSCRFLKNKFLRLYPVYFLAITTASVTQPFFSKTQRGYYIA